MNKHLIILGLFFFSFRAMSQDTTAVAAAPVEIIPAQPIISLDLGIDYSKLATLAIQNEDKYEGIVALNFGFGLSIDGEYGYTKKSPKYLYKNGNYTVEGTYYRVGLGYNIILGESNIFGIGVRYAKSDFQDHTSYTILSTVFENLNYFHTNTVSAQWAELVLKTEGPVKKIKNLKMGMFIRLKYLDPIKYKTDYELFPVQLIPGYGVAKANATAAVNLYIKYSIPLIK